MATPSGREAQMRPETRFRRTEPVATARVPNLENRLQRTPGSNLVTGTVFPGSPQPPMRTIPFPVWEEGDRGECVLRRLEMSSSRQPV